MRYLATTDGIRIAAKEQVVNAGLQKWAFGLVAQSSRRHSMRMCLLLRTTVPQKQTMQKFEREYIMPSKKKQTKSLIQ